MQQNIIDKVINQWRKERISLLSPHDRNEIIVMLNGTGKHISYDVIDLYSLAGGMENGESDKYLWSFWSLEEVINENKDYYKPYLRFADFLIRSHLYCFKYENENTSSVCIDWGDGEEPQQIANSVNEFFELYINSPEKINLYDS